MKSSTLLACLGAGLFVLSLVGCSDSPVDPTCDAGPVAGALSMWTECGPHSLSSAGIPVVLTNQGAETIWYYHECGDESPWPSKLQDDGTWLRLLPPTFFLSIGCMHVMELAPGETAVFSMSTQRTNGPGTYRAEMLIARGCMDLHEPRHVAHSCEAQDFIVSQAFELR